jgi:hypothetical protein
LHSCATVARNVILVTGQSASFTAKMIEKLRFGSWRTAFASAIPQAFFVQHVAKSIILTGVNNDG